MKIQIDKQVIENVLDCWECDATLSDAVVIALKRALTAESVEQEPVADGYLLNGACVRLLVEAAKRYGQDRVTFGVMEEGAGPMGLPAYVGVVSESIENLTAHTHPAPAVPVVKQEPVAWAQIGEEGDICSVRWVTDHNLALPYTTIKLYTAPAVPDTNAALIIEHHETTIEKLRDELERERMRLAACGVAALGYFDGCNDEYRSASLEDTLRLYESNKKYREALEMARDALNMNWAVIDTATKQEALRKIEEVLK